MLQGAELVKVDNLKYFASKLQIIRDKMEYMRL